MMYRSAFALVMFLIAASSLAAEVKYRLQVTDPVHHLANISVTFPAQKEPLVVSMPAWRSGHYKILNLAKGVLEINATTKQRKKLQIMPLDKNSWQIKGGEGQSVTVNYQLYANELNSRTRSITDDHAFLDASATFIYAERWRFVPHSVELKLPKGWRAYSGLAKKQKKFWAASYDILADSPIEAGKVDTYRFSGLRDYLITGWGTKLYDYKQIADDTLKLEAVAAQLWGDFPFQRFVFMLHSAPGLRGATEHLNSTVIQFAKPTLDERKDYLRFFSTLVHEYVHTWNVKSYRPEGITPYDFLNENYSRLLWFAEGATSYYDLLLTYRAGVSEQSEFFQGLAEMINDYQSRPGVNTKSVAQASFDWWRKHQGTPDHNGSVSIYNEGAVVTLALDFWLRENSANKASIDEVHRRLYQSFKNDPSKADAQRGFREQDLIAIMSELAATDAAPVWRQRVTETGPIDVQQLLDFVGLKLVKNKEAHVFDFGWELEQSDGEFPIVITVAKDGSAWRAGIASGDRLLAINKKEFNEQNYHLALDNKWQTSKFEIALLRHGNLHTVSLNADQHNKGNWVVTKQEKASPQQQKNFELWTGQPFNDISE